MIYALRVRTEYTRLVLRTIGFSIKLRAYGSAWYWFKKLFSK